MMEMMQRIYPNEVFPDGHLPRNIPRDTFPRNIPRDMFLGIFRTFFYKRIDRWIYVQKRIDR
uniref:Uncharacterized protein n=1 Tax=Brassica oleracea TaxID=3712 RepID=A0A3P6FFU7_BRAOL|nr:unnamed protein product [Brassica oleracea]